MNKPFFFNSSKNNPSYEENRNIFIGNLNLDSIPRREFEKFPGILKRVLHKRIESIFPNPKRVITRFHEIGDPDHVKRILARALALSDQETKITLNGVLREFSTRHKSIKSIFEGNFLRLKGSIAVNLEDISKDKELLIGSLFTLEYSNEATSLFNPSVVIYPKQNDLKKGQVRVVFSFRATGEGHISSIVFRSAIIEKNNDIYLEPISKFVSTPTVNMNPTYEKGLFIGKLQEINAFDSTAEAIMQNLPDRFTYFELTKEIEVAVAAKKDSAAAITSFSIEEIKLLADSNYEIHFPPDQLISERVIFPVSSSESKGIEDARFVRFVCDDGSISYYATYTAYNGKMILPQLLETKDFHHFKMSTLNGKYAKDKGMALFPRKVNGKYAMISRVDDENLYLMYSDNVNFWNEAVKIVEPKEPWEFIKIGNCGSPIETKNGWILLTHGVGPMREYCIGVVLLDLHDPSIVKVRLAHPLISPTEEEREGYVPNVVYSCGSMILNNQLIIPYASSDSISSIAVISLDELLEKLLKKK